MVAAFNQSTPTTRQSDTPNPNPQSIQAAQLYIHDTKNNTPKLCPTFAALNPANFDKRKKRWLWASALIGWIF
jgi:hypothetical protein